MESVDLVLNSRVAMVGNRRVEIHEMTNSEIEALKRARVPLFFMGFGAGGMATVLLGLAFHMYS